MTSDEFRNLQHGDKIIGPSGLNFIVHNNHRSGPGMIVVVRTEVISARYCHDWHITKKQMPINLNLASGIYQVTIDKLISTK